MIPRSDARSGAGIKCFALNRLYGRNTMGSFGLDEE